MGRSPNFGPRRDGHRPELVVLHYTGMADCDAAERLLCDPARKVSAHYLLSARGRVVPLVDEDMRAWHAGAGAWRGGEGVNSRSIGIELDNDGTAPFAAPMMDALDTLLAGILGRWRIRPRGVIAHSDMAAGRKTDPGPRFDWRRLALQGLAVWPDAAGPAAVDAGAFRAHAARFGYPEMADALLLKTFRSRMRPWAKGPLDGWDCATMADLARRHG